MILNYYKPSSVGQCDFHSSKRKRQTSHNKQKQNKQKQRYSIQNGEAKYYKECFPIEYTIYSINNEIIDNEVITINKQTKPKVEQIINQFELSDEEEQYQIYSQLASFNPQINKRSKERIFESRKRSLSPLQRCLISKRCSRDIKTYQ